MVTQPHTYSNRTRHRSQRRELYEVRRQRRAAEGGMPRKPYVESFYGLDRARLAAFGHALDGPDGPDKSVTGVVEICRIHLNGDQVIREELIDLIDERVAFRFLNDIALPRPNQLSVAVERLQEEVNRLERLGID